MLLFNKIVIETNLRALPLFLDVIVEENKNASPIPGSVMEIGIVQEVKTREAGLCRKLKYSWKPKNWYFLIKSHLNLQIQIIAPFLTVNSCRGECRRGQFPCNNGQCIPVEYRCDREVLLGYDCDDGSDEWRCRK